MTNILHSLYSTQNRFLCKFAASSPLKFQCSSPLYILINSSLHFFEHVLFRLYGLSKTGAPQISQSKPMCPAPLLCGIFPSFASLFLRRLSDEWTIPKFQVADFPLRKWAGPRRGMPHNFSHSRTVRPLNPNRAPMSSGLIRCFIYRSRSSSSVGLAIAHQTKCVGRPPQATNTWRRVAHSTW